MTKFMAKHRNWPNAIQKIETTAVGYPIFTARSNNSIAREIYEALLELNNVDFRIEDDGKYVKYIKNS